jgi:hypothetical protein
MYASLECHCESAAHRGADVELGDRVTVVALCFGFAIWFRDEKSQLQSQQTNRERQSARLSWALTSQPSHILIQLHTECIPRVGPHRIGGPWRPPCLPALRVGRVYICLGL